jgi:dihydropteroate synthase
MTPYEEPVSGPVAPQPPRLGAAPLLCGILNVTPDSFSDGGRYMRLEDAVEHARRLCDEGAAIIDIGGESTRPGARPVPTAEQRRRVLPVLRALTHATGGLSGGCRLSVDTTSAAVAQAALAEGATMVNDVSAGVDDRRMFDVVADAGADLVLMHRRVRPELDSYSDRYGSAPRYGDVVQDVAEFLRKRVEEAEGAGVHRRCIAIDPGLGFGKSVEQNYALLSRLGELAAVHPRILVGLSRKSFLRPGPRAASEPALHAGGSPPGTDSRPADRLPESIAAALLAVLAGASILRVHDVAATRQALDVLHRSRAASASDAPRAGSGGPPLQPRR